MSHPVWFGVSWAQSPYIIFLPLATVSYVWTVTPVRAPCRTELHRSAAHCACASMRPTHSMCVAGERGVQKTGSVHRDVYVHSASDVSDFRARSGAGAVAGQSRHQPGWTFTAAAWAAQSAPAACLVLTAPCMLLGCGLDMCRCFTHRYASFSSLVSQRRMQRVCALC